MTIKPCPFCGDDKPVPSHSENGEWHYVACWGCDATTGPHETAGKAVDAWNRRSPPPELVEAWNEYKRIGWGSGSTDSERDAANWELMQVVKKLCERGTVAG